MRSLWTAATGMQAQQTNMDVISNNLANANTTGYERSRGNFEDLMYRMLIQAGAEMHPGKTERLDVGLGAPARRVPPCIRAVEEGAEPADEELFERMRAGKEARVAKVRLHEHAVRPHRNGMGDGAHGAQDIFVVEIFPFFPGEKSEEFFFRLTLIQHLLFSRLRG